MLLGLLPHKNLRFLYAPDADGNGGGGDTKPKEGDGDGKPKEGDGDKAKAPETLADALALITDLSAKLGEATAQIKTVNGESMGRRKKLEEFERKEAEAAKAKLSEEERAVQEREEAGKTITTLKSKLKAQAIAFEVARFAGKFGFYDPDDAAKLVDLSSVEYDEESGTVKGVEDAVKTLAKSKAHLLAPDKQQQARDIDARNNGKGTKTDERAATRAARFGLKAPTNNGK